MKTPASRNYQLPSQGNQLRDDQVLPLASSPPGFVVLFSRVLSCTLATVRMYSQPTLDVQLAPHAVLKVIGLYVFCCV